MGKVRSAIKADGASLDAAMARAKAYEAQRPRAVRAEYRASDDRVIVILQSGVEMAIPRRLLQGLQTATAADLDSVTVEDFGSALRWEPLDVDHYVPGLLQGVFGNRRWMSAIPESPASSRRGAKTEDARRRARKGRRTSAA